MARLFGLMGNRSDLAGRILGSETDALRVRSRGQPLGWGVGFYQAGEVLMRRRPIDDREEIDMAKLCGDVRADVVLGHVRSATVGTLRTENTHPFRYRQWLFAQTGTAGQFDAIRDRLIASVPTFLRGGIRGETDAELVFHVFLSFLHDAGRLNDLTVEPTVVREALRSSLAVVDGMTAEVGGEPGSFNLMITNGEYLVAAHRAKKLAYRVFAGRNDAEMIIGEDVTLRRKTPELSQMHFVLLASDFDEDLTAALEADCRPHPHDPVAWTRAARRSAVTGAPARRAATVAFGAGARSAPAAARGAPVHRPSRSRCAPRQAGRRRPRAGARDPRAWSRSRPGARRRRAARAARRRRGGHDGARAVSRVRAGGRGGAGFAGHRRRDAARRLTAPAPRGRCSSVWRSAPEELRLRAPRRDGGGARRSHRALRLRGSRRAGRAGAPRAR